MPAVAHDVRALVWSGDSSDDSDSHLRGEEGRVPLIVVEPYEALCLMK